jgi:hypothetical protein
MRVKSFEVSKMKSNKGYAYKVVVHHHDKPPATGKGMKGLLAPTYVPPEEHAHMTRAALHKHINDLTNSMCVSPNGDDNEGEKYPEKSDEY